MKSKSKKKRNLILLLVVLLGISIGFALLSTTLYINGTSTIKGNTWDIHWDESSITESQGSVTATTPAEIVDDTDNQQIQFAASFDLPGDYYEFTVDAVNAGTIDGILKQFETGIYVEDAQAEGGIRKVVPGDEDYPSDLIFTVSYGNGTAPVVDTDVLAKRTDATHFTSQTYKVKVQFDPEAVALPEFGEDEDSKDYIFKVDIKYQQYKAPAQNNNNNNNNNPEPGNGD